MTPWFAFSPMVCRDHVRFDPLIFLNLCGLLTLMPAVVRGANRRSFPRAFAMWVLIRRWTCPGTYNKMVAELHLPRTTLVTLYTTTLKLFVDAYGVLVTVPDSLRIRPQLAQWAHHVHNLTQSPCQHIVAWTGAWLCAASPPTTRAHVLVRRAPACLAPAHARTCGHVTILPALPACLPACRRWKGSPDHSAAQPRVVQSTRPPTKGGGHDTEHDAARILQRCVPTPCHSPHVVVPPRSLLSDLSRPGCLATGLVRARVAWQLTWLACNWRARAPRGLLAARVSCVPRHQGPARDLCGWNGARPRGQCQPPRLEAARRV